MLKKLNKNDVMLKIKYITNLKYRYVTGNLKNTQTLLFYGLPKIHKLFISLPPLRPNAPGVNSFTWNLSKFVDSFVKFQA